jgi:hypothetical protein
MKKQRQTVKRRRCFIKVWSRFYEISIGRNLRTNPIRVCSYDLLMALKCLRIRVARWYISKPKNHNLGKFWGILEWNIGTFGIYYGHFEHFMVIW